MAQEIIPGDSIPQVAAPKDSIQVYSPGNSQLTRSLEILEDLSSGWLAAEGELVSFPWFSSGPDKIILQKAYFGFSTSVPGDTFFLYVSGVLGRGSILLGNRLLGVVTDPFRELLLAIPRDWISNGTLLKIELTGDDPMVSGLIHSVKGIGGDFLLLKNSENPKLVFSILDKANPGMIAVPSSLLAMNDADLFFSKSKIKNAFLPFRPSFRVQKILFDNKVSLLKERPSLPAVLFFPHSPFAENLAFPVPQIPLPGTGKLPVDRITLIFLILAWLVFLLVFRITEPDFIRNFFALVIKPFPGVFGGNSFASGRIWQDIFMVFFRIFIGSMTLSLWVHYFQTAGLLSNLNILSEKSLLFIFVYINEPSLFSFWGLSFSVLLFFELFKMALAAYLSAVFRIYNLGDSLQITENAVVFPLGLLLVVPGIVLFFTESGFTTTLLWLWAILIFIFFLRRLFIIYSGLSMTGRIPATLKFLYICALEIFPWLVII